MGADAEVVVDCRSVLDAAPQVRGLLADGHDVLLLLHPSDDAATGLADVDALARLVLCARRGAGTLRVHADAPDLRRLVELAGLSGVLAVEPG